MSTSLLYHAFGVRGYRYKRLHFQKEGLRFDIEKPREQLRCPQCRGRRVERKGDVERTFRTLPIGGKAVFIHLPIPRVWCFDCKFTRQIRLGFAEPKKHYTRSFERYALDLLRHMTIKDVAIHLQVGWDAIKDIQLRYLQRHYAKPKLTNLKQIAIDEISIGKGHRYVTVVLNLVSGKVVFVGDGKGADALEPFWRRLRRSGAKVKAVATDLSAAYIRAVRDNIPDAVHVFDRFHVVKLFNDKLSAFRRTLYREVSTDQERRVLKGTRWLLLKNPENLDTDRNEQQRLEAALQLNAPLAVAYYLKEDLRQIWEQPNKRTARRVLRDWMKRARASKVS